MGQIIKSVCVCQSVCLCVCPCVVTLTVAFLCRYSPNFTQRCKPPKVRTSSLGVNIAPPLPLFYPQKLPFLTQRSCFWQEVVIRPFCACAIKNMLFGPLLVAESPKFLYLIANLVREHDGNVRDLTGSRNMTVSRMRNKTNMQFGPYLWLNRQNSWII